VTNLVLSEPLSTSKKRLDMLIVTKKMRLVTN